MRRARRLKKPFADAEAVLRGAAALFSPREVLAGVGRDVGFFVEKL